MVLLIYSLDTWKMAPNSGLSVPLTTTTVTHVILVSMVVSLLVFVCKTKVTMV